jgi:hypothetical protein
VTYPGRDDQFRLQDSAREWQKLQIGVLGFVGLCGVLSGGDSGRTRPPWLQEVGAVAAVSGLVLALVGVLLVASVAHPIAMRPKSATRATRRLVVGISITVAAVALTALAALTWWWPQSRTDTATGPALSVTTRTGQICGTVIDGGTGTLALNVAGEQLNVPLRAVVSIDVVAKC